MEHFDYRTSGVRSEECMITSVLIGFSRGPQFGKKRTSSRKLVPRF